MAFKIINLTEDKFQDWDKFCLTSNDAWFWHTTEWLTYILNYKPALATENFSFFVYRDDKIQAIVPLTRELKKYNNKDIYEFSFGGGDIPIAALNNDLSANERMDLYDFIFKEINRLAMSNQVACIKMRQTPLSINSLRMVNSPNHLLKFGYTDASFSTQIINFKKKEEELWNDLRRNHARNIRKGSIFNITVYNAENIERSIFNEYKETHFRAAGRQTRPDKTFELMYYWIKMGLGFLVVVQYQNRNIGFECYVMYKNIVSGLSAANDPDYEHLPIRHALEWNAILWMKKQGVKYYEIGKQRYGILPYSFPDKKLLDIPHFKRGFGGQAFPLFCVEKYCDKDYFLEIYRERMEKFAASFDNDKK